MENSNEQAGNEPLDESTALASEENVTQSTAPVINQDMLNQYIQRIKLEQNLVMAIVAGLGASVAGAIAWATITLVTNYQIGYMAVALGFLVGYAIRVTGKGIDKSFGYIGAALALFGCLLGNVLTIIGLAAKANGVDYFTVLGQIDFGKLPGVMADTFNPMDVLFYGIAIYEGYKFSFRRITREEVIQHATQG